MNHNTWNRLRGVLEDKGFYIVLFLCVAAIGISGYYLFSTLSPEHDPAAAVGKPVPVTVTPTPTPDVSPSTVAEPTQPQAAPSVQPAQPAPTVTAAPSAAPSPSARPTAVFVWPVLGEVLTWFSVETLAYDPTMGDWRTHGGVDIAADVGEQVRAIAAGTVIDVVQDDLMGTSVYVDHGDGLTSCCANLAGVPAVEIGDTVSAGQVIGSVGKTAIAESGLTAHLHLELAQDGAPVDPLDFLP